MSGVLQKFDKHWKAVEQSELIVDPPLKLLVNDPLIWNQLKGLFTVEKW